jgi:ketosteroid isomerase-like protein
MAGELESAARALMARLDSMDVDALIESATDDIQAIDELSRRWVRGKDEGERYMRQMVGALADVRTELRDVEERVWGDTGVLTCWIDQDYTFEGNPQRISAPTTIVFRREDGDWKVALSHMVPLPEDG